MKLLSQSLKVERYCARKETGEEDVNEVDCNDASGTLDSLGGASVQDLGSVRRHSDAPREGRREPDAPNTDQPQGNSGMQAGGP